MELDLESGLRLAFARYERLVSPAYVRYLLARDDIPLFLEQYPHFVALAVQWILPEGSDLYNAYAASHPEVTDPIVFFVMEYLCRIAKTQPGERIHCDPLFSPTVQ